MAKKNKEFLLALKNTRALRGAVKNDRDRALEAILIANETDQAAFEKAVLDHKVFWGTIDGPNLSNLVKRPSMMGGYDYLELGDTTDTFKLMKLQAAEERVKFALEGAPDDVLIGILTADMTGNGKELRKYLETKQNSLGLRFDTIPGWNQDNEEILTKTALNNIRTEAANQLLLKALAKPGITDPKLFDDLVKAHTPPADIEKIKAAAKALIDAGGIDLHGAPPEAFTDALTVDLSPEIVDTATKNRDKLLDAAAVAKFYEQKVKDEHILGLEASLKKAPEALLDDLLNPLVAGHLELDPDTLGRIRALQAGEKKTIGAKVQKELCERFIQAELEQRPTIADVKHVADLLNSNLGGIVAPLKALAPSLGDDNIINKAIPDDNNIVKFKVALLKHRLNDMALGDLQTLDKATKPEDFAKKFATLLGKDTANHDTKLDFLKPEHINGAGGLREIIRGRLGNLKRDERTTEFEAKVEALARFGKDAHPALIAVFKDLPNKKQLEILSEPQKLLLIINAKSESEIQSYLGKENKSGGVLVVDRLIAENERVALLRQIYNPAIAKVLAGLDLTLTQTQIDNINVALLNHRALDVTGIANYKTLIDDIRAAVNVPANTDAFYQAFSFTDYNANVMAPDTTVADAVKGQHLNNRPLLVALHGATLNAAQKELVKVLLRVGEAIPDMDSDVNIQSVYNDKFKGSPSVHTFLDKLITGVTPQDKALKEKISRELTPDVYSKLRGDYYDEVIARGSQQQKLSLVEGLNNFLKGVQESKPTIKEYKKHLKALTQNLESLPYLYSGANEAKAKKKAEKMLGDYKAFEKQCDTLIEHLAAAKRDLQVRLDHTPIPVTDHSPDREKLIKELTELHAKLKAEIEFIDEQLPYFHEVKKQISGKDGAIAKIEGIMSHKLTAMVETTNISYSEVAKSEIKTAAFQKKAGATEVDLTEGQSNLDTDSPTFKLEKIPEKGKVRCVDMVHVKATPTQADPNKTTEYTGRIAIDYHPSSPTSTLSGKGVTQSRPVKVSIVTAMKDKDYLAEQMMEAAKNLLKDWDGKSPIKLKGVHGKDTELAHLWTAVCVLGEHHPKFSRDKVQIVGTSSFRPDSQRNWRGYTEGSLYNKVYKGSAKGLVEEKVNEFKQLVDDKKRKEVDEGLSKANQLWKDKLSGIEQKVNKDVEVQGPMQSRLSMNRSEED
ncbi:hypothetical protein [Legionella tucsonensis]|uniref:Interaptin n=1 Tax=Legionella tucsonensis TaxID=40335 RepID=A0A0W0ZXY3_9GAMM|nr:hypothetical protein [Legionella tucsonensis]KTD73941.1 interaptin [Legionella tucsonensis]